MGSFPAVQHHGYRVALSPYWLHREQVAPFLLEQTYKCGGYKHVLLQFTLGVKEPD